MIPVDATKLGLQVLYDSFESLGIQPQVEYVLRSSVNHGITLIFPSVIAVHGIGADPDRTWTTNKGNLLKDRHMLPESIPNSRIMRFGYASQWLGKEAINQRLPLVSEQLLHSLVGFRKASSGSSSTGIWL